MSALPIIIDEWPRNSREVVRLQLDSYQGCRIVDVRCWYRDAHGELKPGKSGINLSADRHLRKLAQALADAVIKAEELGLLDAENTDSRQELAGADRPSSFAQARP